MLTKEHKIVMGVSMPRNLREQIDQKRGDIPRSKYISRVLERQLEHENDAVNQQNQSRPLPGKGSADSPPFSSTTHLGVVLQMDNDNYASVHCKGCVRQYATVLAVIILQLQL